MTIRERQAKVDKRQASALELMQDNITALKARDHFNSYITRTFEEALEQAANPLPGMLRGIPIAHKDIFYTRGLKTTAGSLVFKDFVPKFDGAVVANLKAAGAISTGKTNLHELAYGVTSNNPHYGPVLNPHDPKRIPGGSSGGSAALIGAGLLPIATGSDTGGSIRIPASYCGITGIKPTYELVSRRGILPLSYGLDHAGPMAGCVEDLAIALNAMSGTWRFNLDALATLSNLRVGVPEAFFFEGLDVEVEKTVRSRIGEMGAVLVDVKLPDFHQVNAAARVIQMSESAALYVNYQDAALFGRDVWANLEDGRQIYGHEYVNAQRMRAIHRREMDAVWQTVDVIVTPTTPITAPLRNSATVEINGKTEDVRMASTRLVRGWNYLGEPALSLPCGKDSKGLPIGMQLIAAPFADARLVQIAKTLERLWS